MENMDRRKSNSIILPLAIKINENDKTVGR
jgi:hypothetical protein